MKHYPNCLQDGFRTSTSEAYCIAMIKPPRFYVRTSKGRVLTSWHWCGAKLFTCFNDAKIVADQLRAKGKRCIVRRLEVET